MVVPLLSLSRAKGGFRAVTKSVYTGNKKDNVTVIYTPWSNLHKNAGMATGQVGFHDQKKVPFTPFLLFPPSIPFAFHSIPFHSLLSPLRLFRLSFQQLTLPSLFQVLKTLVPTRHNAIINRLTKTRTIASTDSLASDKEAHLKQLRAKAHAVKQAERKEEERVRKEQREEKWKREHAYEELHKGLGEDDGGDADEGTRGRSNQEEWDEDDFM